MNTFTVTATQAKQNFSDVLNRVIYEKKTAIIEKHGKIVAELSPSKSSDLSLKEKLAKFYGAIPDFPNVKKFRRNKRHWRTI